MDSENTQLLKKIYQNSKTALDAISAVSKKSKSFELDNLLDKQKYKYFDIAEDANMLLRNSRKLPEEDMWARIGFFVTLKLETTLNSNSGHIAEVLIEGCVGGINEMISQINSLKDVEADCLDLANILIETEQETISLLQKFL